MNSKKKLQTASVIVPEPVNKPLNTEMVNATDNISPRQGDMPSTSLKKSISQKKSSDNISIQEEISIKSEDKISGNEFSAESNEQPAKEEDFDTPLEGELIDSNDDFDLSINEGNTENYFSVTPIATDDGSSSKLPTVVLRDNIQTYLREINKFPMLTPEEETQLTREVRDTGNPEAAFRIISSHLRLVVRIAMDFQKKWMQNVLDLIQEGNVGLIRAVNKFDPDKGIKFAYYASFWIKAYILKFIMDNWRMVKIGTTQSQRKLFYNLNKERQRLVMQGFDPTPALLSQKLGVTEEQVSEMEQRLEAVDVSLNAPVNDDGEGATHMDFLPATEKSIEEGLASSQIANIVRSSVKEIMPKLSEKERFIMENRLLTDDPMTLREIGDHYHVTRERIRQVEIRLLEKLKAHLKSKVDDFSEDWINN